MFQPIYQKNDRLIKEIEIQRKNRETVEKVMNDLSFKLKEATIQNDTLNQALDKVKIGGNAKPPELNLELPTLPVDPSLMLEWK